MSFLRSTRVGLASLLLGCLAAVPAQAEVVIGFWDFNDGFDVPDETPQIVHNATIGSAILYQQRADTDGNGASDGIAYTNTSLGINAIGDRAMAWDDVSKSGDNDAEFFLGFSTAGLQDIRVRFDVRGNADGGIAAFDIKFDTNPLEDVTNPGDVVGTIKDFQGGLSTDFANNLALTAPAGAYSETFVDFSSIGALNNQSFVAIRFDDFDGNDEMTIDNILITATAVPEPGSVAALIGIAGVGLWMQRRRRQKTA